MSENLKMRDTTELAARRLKIAIDDFVNTHAPNSNCASMDMFHRDLQMLVHQIYAVAQAPVLDRLTAVAEHAIYPLYAIPPIPATRGGIGVPETVSPSSPHRSEGVVDHD